MEELLAEAIIQSLGNVPRPDFEGIKAAVLALAAAYGTQDAQEEQAQQAMDVTQPSDAGSVVWEYVSCGKSNCRTCGECTIDCVNGVTHNSSAYGILSRRAK